MEKDWLGLPFRPISESYQQRFGEKVYKIPVSVADDCPNRRGLKGMQTCVFCDVWGSAARTETMELPLAEQISKVRSLLAKKYKAKSFLVYFQAYTNTFLKLETLKQHFETALASEQIRGVVVGTRPDCLSKGVLDLWQSTHERSFVSVELGVQSFFDDQLEFMKRGHTREQSLKAIERISRETQVDLGIHLMFGQPGESLDQIRETAEICNSLPISNVKLHNLHVLKNTELEKLWDLGEFAPIEFSEYAHKVQIFLEHLSPRIFVHRLAAFSSRPDELISPAWTADKMRTHQGLVDQLRARQSYQSRHYQAQTPLEQVQKDELCRRSKPLSLVEHQNFTF